MIQHLVLQEKFINREHYQIAPCYFMQMIRGL